jgi:hypothetical protein
MPANPKFLLLCALALAAQGQDRHDWQSLAKLQPGDSVRLSLKGALVEGAFQNWTPEQVTAGTTTAKREDVLKVERHHSGGTRGRHAAIGALIGFGAGFALGAGTGGCNHNQFGPCITRGEGGAIVGGVGAILGAGIGVLLPRHNWELVYSTR